MSVEEEVWRIRAEVLGIASYEHLEKQIRENSQWQDALNTAFRAGSIAEAQFTEQTTELIREQQKLGQQLQFTKAHLEDVADATDKVEEAGKKGKKGSSDLAAGILEISRAAEDAQYGLAGVLNNIPNIVQRFGAALGVAAGPAAAAAAAISLLAVGVKVLYDQWDNITGLFEERKPIEELDKAMNNLDGLIKNNNKELEELRKKVSLNSDEQSKYNKLVAEQVRLEKEKNDQKEREKRLKTFDEIKPAGEKEDAKERAKMLEATLGGQKDQLVKAVEGATDRTKVDKAYADLQFAIRSQGEQQRDDPFNLTGMSELLAKHVKDAQSNFDNVMKQRNEAARDLVSRVMTEGDPLAMKQLKDVMAKAPERFTDFQRFAVGEADPAARRKEQDVIERQIRMNKLDIDLKKKQADAAKAAEKDMADFNKDVGKELKEAPKGPGAVAEDKAPKGKISTPAEIEKGRVKEFAGQIEARSKVVGDRFTPEESEAISQDVLDLQKKKGMGFQPAMNAAIRKAREGREKAQDEAGIAQVAEQMEARGFTPEVSKNIATEALKLNKQGVNAMTAIDAAMTKALVGFQELSADYQRLFVRFNGLGNQFGQVARNNQGGMTAQQMGRGF